MNPTKNSYTNLSGDNSSESSDSLGNNGKETPRFSREKKKNDINDNNMTIIHLSDDENSSGEIRNNSNSESPKIIEKDNNSNIKINSKGDLSFEINNNNNSSLIELNKKGNNKLEEKNSKISSEISNVNSNKIFPNDSYNNKGIYSKDIMNINIIRKNKNAESNKINKNYNSSNQDKKLKLSDIYKVLCELFNDHLWKNIILSDYNEAEFRDKIEIIIRKCDLTKYNSVVNYYLANREDKNIEWSQLSKKQKEKYNKEFKIAKKFRKICLLLIQKYLFCNADGEFTQPICVKRIIQNNERIEQYINTDDEDNKFFKERFSLKIKRIGDLCVIYDNLERIINNSSEINELNGKDIYLNNDNNKINNNNSNNFQNYNELEINKIQMYEKEAIEQNIRNERLLVLKSLRNKTFDENIYTEYLFFKKLVLKYYPEIQENDIQIYYQLLQKEKHLYNNLMFKLHRHNLSVLYVKHVNENKNNLDDEIESVDDDESKIDDANDNKINSDDELNSVGGKRKKLNNKNNYVISNNNKIKNISVKNKINNNINKINGNNINKVNNLVINLNEYDEEEEDAFNKKGKNYKYLKDKYQKNKIYNNNKNTNSKKDNKHSSLSGNNNISQDNNSNVQNLGCAPIFNNNFNKKNKK